MAVNTDTYNTVAATNWRAYQRARDSGHDDYVDRAKQQSKFYLGDQWSEADRKKLEAQGRPALTINLTMKEVNTFLGKYESMRTEFEFAPKRGTDEATARTLNALIRAILRENDYQSTEFEMFKAGIVSDRGYLRVRMDFSTNLMGDVVIEDYDELEVLPDPDAKTYDPAGWNSVIFTRWVTLEDIEATWGKEKRLEVESVSQNYASFGEDSIRYDGTRTFGADEFDTLNSEQRFGYDEDQRDIRAVRVIEREYKRMSRRRYFVDNVTGDMEAVPHHLPDERVMAIAEQFNMSVITKVEPQIRWTVSVDNVVLHDDWSPFRTLTVIPYFPYFYRGKTSGVVKQLMSPQEQVNKGESQMLHIVNTMANSGWSVRQGSLTNMDIEELEARGAETGLVIEHNGEAPEKIEPNRVPTGLDRLTERARQSVTDITGATGLQADQVRDVAGVALQRQEAASLIQMQVPFASLRKTRRILARKLLELVQDFYTETRVLRVTVGRGLEQYEEEMVINAVDAAGNVLNDMTIGEYDITVVERPAYDSIEQAQFAAAMQMRDAGVMIPDDEVIRVSMLDDKDRIADRVASLTGTAPPTKEEAEVASLMQQAEIRAALAEAGKLEADIQLTQAKAAETFAKAQTVEGEAQFKAMKEGAELNRKMAELQAKLQMFYSDLQNKIQLAQIHSQANLQETMFTEATRAATEELKARLQPPRTPTSNS